MKRFDGSRPWKNILCIYPYTYRNPYYVFPPLAVEYIAGAVRDLAEKVTVVDMRFETDLAPYMEDADIVCTFGHFEDCSIFGQMRAHSLAEIAELVPEGVPLVTGGTVSMDLDAIFRDCPRLDVAIRGSPEVTVRELFERGTPEGVRNLVYRKDDGEVVRNEIETHPLSETVLPARDLRRYRYETWGMPCDIVRTSVGCNYKCRFCYQYGKGIGNTYLRWQGRSAESIFEELKTSEAEVVAFIDDDLLVDMDRMERLCDLIIESGMRKMYAGNGRIDHIIGRKRALRKMERAGFLGFSYGVESIYNRTLRLYRKGTNVGMIEEGLRLAAKTNMLLIASFILGSPGESEEEILEYLRFARRFDIDTVVTNRMRIPRECDLYEIVYDPATGELRDEKYRMVQGADLARIKYAIKFGQRTPLRLLLQLLKLGRHRGAFLDPFYIFTSFIRTALRDTRTGRNVLVRGALACMLFVFRRRLWRWTNRFVSTLLYRPLRLVNRLVEYVDTRLEVSTTVLPRLFGMFRRRVYEKQRLKHGWRDAPGGKRAEKA